MDMRSDDKLYILTLHIIIRQLRRENVLLQRSVSFILGQPDLFK